MVQCKIYLSDEGFGPIVRQRAIIQSIKKIDPSIDFTIQTKNHIDRARRVIKSVNYKKKFNNIIWHKHLDGSPDLKKIKSFYSHYIPRSDAFIKEESESINAGFIISDFIFEAFEVGHLKKIPAFGVAHFSWDWFFSKLFPLPLKTNLLKRFSKQAKKARYLFFPPFTPQEILNLYRHNAIEVPLIVNDSNNRKIIFEEAKKFKILIMDSGANVLNHHIRQILPALTALKDFHFFISSNFHFNNENITLIDESELFIDYIPYMNLVISRAGFNTISECIAKRVPMLLLSESMNPEMNENIIAIKKVGLGSFISKKQFVEELPDYLPRFIEHEYLILLERIKSHDIKTNGSQVIANKIMESI